MFDNNFSSKIKISIMYITLCTFFKGSVQWYYLNKPIMNYEQSCTVSKKKQKHNCYTIEMGHMFFYHNKHGHCSLKPLSWCCKYSLEQQVCINPLLRAVPKSSSSLKVKRCASSLSWPTFTFNAGQRPLVVIVIMTAAKEDVKLCN